MDRVTHITIPALATAAARRTRPTPGQRLRVRVQRLRLDRELANGAPLEDSRLRLLRARQLIEPRTRRRVAASIRSAARDAGPSRRPGLGSRIAGSPPALPLREGLIALPQLLESTAAVDAR